MRFLTWPGLLVNAYVKIEGIVLYKP
jgi:hypothetical protein